MMTMPYIENVTKIRTTVYDIFVVMADMSNIEHKERHAEFQPVTVSSLKCVAVKIIKIGFSSLKTK